DSAGTPAPLGLLAFLWLDASAAARPGRRPRSIADGRNYDGEIEEISDVGEVHRVARPKLLRADERPAGLHIVAGDGVADERTGGRRKECHHPVRAFSVEGKPHRGREGQSR